jgi:hypothetical protein
MDETLIISSADRATAIAGRANPLCATTPLEAIVRLEGVRRIRTIVLAGSYALNRELAAFLAECYPAVNVECEV